MLHQILVNENFTRSVVYSLKRIDFYLERVTGNDINETATLLLRGYGRLYSKVRFMDPGVLNHVAIESFLTEVKADLLAFNRQLEQHFFSYS